MVYKNQKPDLLVDKIQAVAPAGGAITPEAFRRQLPKGRTVEEAQAALDALQAAYQKSRGLIPQAPEAQAGSR